MDHKDRPEPLFGVSVVPWARNYEQLLSQARTADTMGIDLFTVQDHAYNPGFLDTWTLLAVMAGQTKNIRFLPNVVTLPLRPPAMLAKSSATLDILSGGRFELGLGAGAFWDGIVAYGGKRLTPGEALAALREGIEVIRLLWNSSPSRPIQYSGQHYQLVSAQAGPAPAHPVGIWLGSIGPKMLKLTGELADGWIVSTGYVPPQQAIESGKIIDDAVLAAGRAPRAVRRAYNVAGAILRPEQTNMRANRADVLVGPPALWAETLASYYHKVGMDTFIFWPAGGNDAQQFRLFAEEVVPTTRAAIAAS